MIPNIQLPPARVPLDQMLERLDKIEDKLFQLDTIEDKLDEVRDRLTRTETRLVLLMRSHGLDANGKYID